MNTKKIYARKYFEDKFGPLTVALFLRAYREADGLSQSAFAKKLKLSRANLCDIEKGRKHISPERAANIAKALGESEAQLIRLSIQDSLRAANLNYSVEIRKVS